LNFLKLKKLRKKEQNLKIFKKDIKFKGQEMRVYITDLEAYNQGHLIGGFYELPMDENLLAESIENELQRGKEICNSQHFHEQLLEDAIDSTLIEIEAVQIKAKFWDKHRETKLNERQKKVILKMLSYLPDEFEGGMRVQKYMGITKATRLTASRDLSDLLLKGVMQSHGKGRGVYYSLVL
jgi:hypothetical protein